ncbi:alpha/beta fold hydrolase [Piscinibacterium candidicorallinum]|uniref:Alpha/beta fold hydrolase n=1 Tax=Piscinibacterium candidicorallinum TaxID=1793872 RepID=A0ABV7H783_9BURK
MSTTELFDLPLQHAAGEGGVRIAYRTAGQGRPLLLMHGHPQTHVLWHKVWAELTARFTCVAIDLRGYGDSDKPEGAPPHTAYSKRTMAADALTVMRALGHECFAVLAHDRGARVAHRLALDHPLAVQRLMLLDIAPTLDMYRGATETFARLYYHWFFLIQPAPYPETLIGQDPAYYVRKTMAGRFGATGDTGFGPFDPCAMAEYERASRTPGWAHAVCEDYRAAATIDLAHDEADRAAGRKIECPLSVIVGANGVVSRLFDAQALWARQARGVEFAVSPGGHYVPEEAPAFLLERALPFLSAI